MNENIILNQYDLTLLQKNIDNCSFINKLDLINSKKLFTASNPIKHIFLNDLWDESFLDQISQEIINFNDWEREIKHYGSELKRYQSQWDKFPPKTYKILNFLNSPLFLETISYITNQKFLIPDPYLVGGGIHSTKENGFLKLHADFNWHPQMQVYRRINVLIYLNKNWQSKNGGQIELGTKKNNGVFEILHSELPIFNKTLVFITDDHSFHGQPNPVKNTGELARNSLAVYYYQSKKPENTSEIKRTGTNYVNKFGKPEKGKIKDRIKLKLRKIFNFKK